MPRKRKQAAFRAASIGVEITGYSIAITSDLTMVRENAYIFP